MLMPHWGRCLLAFAGLVLSGQSAATITLGLLPTVSTPTLSRASAEDSSSAAPTPKLSALSPAKSSDSEQQPTSPAVGKSVKTAFIYSSAGLNTSQEQSMLDAFQLGVAKINDRQDRAFHIEVIASDVSKVKGSLFGYVKSLKEQGIEAVFTGVSPVLRKRLEKPIIRNKMVAFYLQPHEGLQDRRSFIHLGPLINQQVMPSLEYFVTHDYNRFMVVYEQDIRSILTHEVIQDYIGRSDAEVVSTVKIGPGAGYQTIVNVAKASKPDLIINLLSGDNALGLFTALREGGVFSHRLPTLSIYLTESEVSTVDINYVYGEYFAWGHFHGLESEQNETFVDDFLSRYGDHRFTGDTVATAYSAAELWYEAYRKAQNRKDQDFYQALLEVRVETPLGKLYIDEENWNAWRYFHLGQLMPDGQAKVIWSSESYIPPFDRPVFRSRLTWQQFIRDMFVRMGGAWGRDHELR